MKKLFLTAFVLFGLVLVSQAQTKHTIGEKFGGGLVFYVSANGLTGLIVETIDQGQCDWDQAKVIAKTGKHSEAGKAFTDWYLPSIDELNKLFIFLRGLGYGFYRTDLYYWSSTETSNSYAVIQSFGTSKQGSIGKRNKFLVRAVRAF